MKLSTGILLASGATAFDAHIENFQVVKTRTSRLYVQWDVVGDDKDQVTDYDVLVYDQSLSKSFEKIRMHEPAHGYREIHGLKPAQKYFIIVKPLRAEDNTEWTGQDATFEAYTSAKPITMGYITNRNQHGAMIEWSPVEGADQYRITNTVTGEIAHTTATSHWATMESGATNLFEITSVTCGDDCANPPNDAAGKPYELSVTSVPPAPLNLRLLDIDVANIETADATVQWDNPEFGSWDSVKIEYSPNNPPAKTATPTYNASGDLATQMVVEGLYQNTIYTFTARFVSNGIEGPAETYSYPINDYSYPGKPNGVTPKTQTCRVPTYLRAENLRVRREVFSENGAFMEVSWDHPQSKRPEQGYKLVFAPFKDVVDQKPWSVNVSSDTDKFVVDGHQYDPYDDYTVSVVALHDEYTGAADPDFIASHFTGTVTKLQHQGTFVAPDACCGPTRHNSKDSSCCGGNLANDDELCCGDYPYQPTQFQCCPNASGGSYVVSIFDQC